MSRKLDDEILNILEQHAHALIKLIRRIDEVEELLEDIKEKINIGEKDG